jgi:steroid delta-isomerase-like uncharacterized protein
MSTEENKALVRRWYEKFNEHSLAGIMEDYAPDLVAHGTGSVPDMDLAGVKRFYVATFAAFPDAQLVIEDLIAEGDKVVQRWTMHGTHRGEFMGIPPTGKRVSLTGINIARIKDGKFVEGWNNEDDLGLMQQLGAIPQVAPTGA